MTSTSVGSRVFAVRDADDETVNLIGWGVYEGFQPCPPLGGIPNPKITLDDGAGVVWGCQCWWGPYERFDEFARGRTITNVGPPE